MFVCFVLIRCCGIVMLLFCYVDVSLLRCCIVLLFRCFVVVRCVVVLVYRCAVGVCCSCCLFLIWGFDGAWLCACCLLC